MPKKKSKKIEFVIYEFNLRNSMMLAGIRIETEVRFNLQKRMEELGPPFLKMVADWKKSLNVEVEVERQLGRFAGDKGWSWNLGTFVADVNQLSYQFYWQISGR